MSYQYRDPHVKDKTVSRLIFNMGIPMPGKDSPYIDTGRKFAYHRHDSVLAHESDDGGHRLPKDLSGAADVEDASEHEITNENRDGEDYVEDGVDDTRSSHNTYCIWGIK